MKEALITELTEHVADELRHADMLALRIIQLGGRPLLKPEDWYKMTNKPQKIKILLLTILYCRFFRMR